MAVVAAVILLLTTVFCALGAMTLRNQQVNTRLERLTEEAREISFLAAQNYASTAALLIGMDDTTQKYLRWKAEKVFEQYGAYIVVVDRRGRIMDNQSMALEDDPDFSASLNGAELREAMLKVLSGEEVSVRVMLGGEAVFTVGVPFVQNKQVLGAVLIHTKAQRVEGGLTALLWPLIGIVLLVTLLAAAGIFLYVRSVLTPLKELTNASKAMAEGDYHVRVSTEHLNAEIREVANTFNKMADQVSAMDASRREFVANVSHELRSPITSIGGFVEGMLDGTIPEEERGRYLQVVADETRRLSKLIEKLLALSRLERDDAALEYSEFDMCELLRRCLVRRVNDLDLKQMEVDVQFQEDPCMVHADSERMEQVIINLLDNALKFTPDHGKLTLRTETLGDKIQVTIMDNGIGILPQDREHIFERFFTADRAHTSGKGTGLGLSICQRIMQMHGETIRLLDVPQGAAFALTLARSKESKGREHNAGT